MSIVWKTSVNVYLMPTFNKIKYKNEKNKMHEINLQLTWNVTEAHSLSSGPALFWYSSGVYCHIVLGYPEDNENTKLMTLGTVLLRVEVSFNSKDFQGAAAKNTETCWATQKAALIENNYKKPPRAAKTFLRLLYVKHPSQNPQLL